MPLMAIRAETVRTWLFALVWLAALIGLRFHDLTGAWWRADDPALLDHALQSPGLAAYTDPGNWRALSPNNLTPWVTLSFKVDLALFGLRPAGFYAHQLLSTLAMTLIAFGLLCRYVSPAWALGTLTVFLLGAPAGAVIEALMTRHYLEGLLAALVALQAFLRAAELPGTRAGRVWQAIALLAYAVAASAKEIYVPLPLLLAAWPGLGGWRERLRRVAPLLALLLLYMAWRRYMLGAYVGGYGVADLDGMLGVVGGFASALRRFPAYFWGQAWPLAAIVVIACALASVRAWRWLAVLPALVLAPLVPLVSYPGLNGPDRYLFLPWFVLCVLVGVALPRVLPASRLRWPVAGVAAAALIAPTVMQESEQAAGRQRLASDVELQGRFLWSAPSETLYRPSDALASMPWYAQRLCAIRQRVRAEACPQVVLQGFDRPPDDREILHLADGRMQPMSPAARAAGLDVDRSRPLSVELDWAPGSIRWKFGPSDGGAYFLLSRELWRFPIAREGRLQRPRGGPDAAFEFQLLHVDAAGVMTVSPTLRITEGQTLRWSR
jgi:hypothetical protein